jgi:hypothetical protein
VVRILFLPRKIKDDQDARFGIGAGMSRRSRLLPDRIGFTGVFLKVAFYSNSRSMIVRQGSRPSAKKARCG